MLWIIHHSDLHRRSEIEDTTSVYSVSRAALAIWQVVDKDLGEENVYEHINRSHKTGIMLLLDKQSNQE